MKRIMKLLMVYIPLCQNIFAQNIGIGTTSPLSRLDINGDIALRSADITINTTYNYALDVSTLKRSNYKLKPSSVPVGNFIIAGITSGVEGRIITLTNRTSNSLEIYNEDATANAANRIQTGIGGTVAIYPGGAVTLLYDATDQRWSIKSMHYNSLDYFGGSGGGGWSLTGNAGTTSANFLGTTDNQPLLFKVNSNTAGMISPLNVNTAFGYLSLSANATGNANTANGHNALRFNSAGSYNTAMGTSALRVNGASDNTAVGYRTLSLNETGQQNTALGASNLTNNVSGSGNTAIGFESMSQGNVPDGNTAVGFQTLYSLSEGAEGYHNAFGYRALASLQHGFGNTAIGRYSMENSINVSGNTAVGGNTLVNANSPSQFNTAIGFGALERSTTGIQNTAIGMGALEFITTGSFNTAIGQGAGTLIGGISNSTVIGTAAKVSLSNMMMFGNEGVEKWGFGNATPSAGFCLAVGTTAANGNGAKLTNGGVWTNASDKNLKEDFQKLDSYNILAKVNNLEITRWRYKGLHEYHIGPMAQDFYKLFNTGNDDKSISTIDPAGVALLSIQALIKENKALKTEMQTLQLQVAELKKLVEVIAAKNNRGT
jgi:hypothetical protein